MLQNGEWPVSGFLAAKAKGPDVDCVRINIGAKF